MKKLIFTCAMLTGLSMVSFAQANQMAPTQATNAVQAPTNVMQPSEQQLAQQKKQAEQMAERQTSQMKQQYGLNDEQYKKVFEVNQAFMTKMMANRNPPNRQSNPNDRQAIMDEKNAKLKKILTPEQYSKYETSMPPARPMSNNPTTPTSK